MKRSEQITFSVTPDFKERMQEIAEKKGLRLASLARMGTRNLVNGFEDGEDDE